MAGLPTPENNSAKLGTLLEVEIFKNKMKADAYSQDTIDRYGRALETLSKRVNGKFLSIQTIKDTIANQEWSNGTKQNVVNAVTLFLKYNGIQAELPKYKRKQEIVFIPLESELDQLISGCYHKLATFLQVLKETGARYGEIIELKWTNNDTEAQIINISPEKGSNPRTIRISNKLLAMLNILSHNNKRFFNYASKKCA